MIVFLKYRPKKSVTDMNFILSFFQSLMTQDGGMSNDTNAHTKSTQHTSLGVSHELVLFPSSGVSLFLCPCVCGCVDNSLAEAGEMHARAQS